MSTIKWPLWLVVAGLLLAGWAAPPRQDATSTPAVETPTVDPNPTAEATIPFAFPTWVSPTPDATGAIPTIRAH